MLSQIEPVFVLQLLQGFAATGVPSMTGNFFFRSLRATAARAPCIIFLAMRMTDQKTDAVPTL